MLVQLDCEMWVVDNGDDVLTLTIPLAVNRATGRGAPGFVDGKVAVLPAGTKLVVAALHIHRLEESCKLCE